MKFLNLKSTRRLAAVAISSVLFSTASFADGDVDHKTHFSDSHAPVGVMADHFHKQGEWMFSYRFMRMEMEGNLIGDDSVSPEEIATTVANRFFGTPGQPPTLRVVPTEMTTNMHMFGTMYGYSDNLTLMLMLNYLEKEMTHVTFQGGMGTTVLGNFTTNPSGIGDTKIAGLYRLSESDNSRFHATFGLSLPTGSIDETGTVLAPNNMRPTIRLPYQMQLGSGTYDIEGGLTYTQFTDSGSFGGQWKSTIRTGTNDENYTQGDIHELTAWYAHRFNSQVSGSLRLKYFNRGNVDGIDPVIVAPVQTANPDFQAAKRWDIGIGLNTKTQAGHRFAFEYLVPISQDLDGPQMEMQSGLTLGYQYAW